MAMSLADQIVLITGASSGIGAACARAIAPTGARLILAARRLEPLQALSSELQTQHGTDVLTVELDVRNAGAVSALLSSLPEPWRDIAVLVNNAGLSRGLDKQYEAPLEDWEAMIDTNIKGLLYVTRAVVPGMVARGCGHVVNVGSIAGRQTYPGGSVYCATKAAVRSLSEGLKLDLLGTPVRVTNIDPGLVETEFSLVRFGGDVDRAQGVYRGMTPLTGEDVADVVVFAITRPAHVNLSDVLLLPTDQSSMFHIHRRAE